MGFSYFTRRYFRNHCYFLFLRLVICLNSAGSLARLRSWFRIIKFANNTCWHKRSKYRCDFYLNKLEAATNLWLITSPNINNHSNDDCYFTLSVLICRPSGERGSRNTRNRYLRSSYCCSVYPAVHNSYRALLRSSSIREPSDPPLRVIKLLFLHVRTFPTLV